MGLGSVVSSAAKIGSGAVKALTGAVGGSSNWLPLAGSLAGAGLGLAGGIYSANKGAQVANNVNLLNYKQAKEFAQNALQWRVADAKKAGLHPLIGVGASFNPGAPTAIGSSSDLGSSLSDLGQNISRAVDAHMSRAQRQRELEKQEALNALELRMKLDQFALNQKEVASRIALNNARAKAQVTNAVKGSSFMRHAQPRIPPRPVITSRGRFGIPSIAADRVSEKPVVDLEYIEPRSKGDTRPDLFKGYRMPDNSTMYLIDDNAADSMENMWGLGEAYAYGILAKQALKVELSKAAKRHRKLQQRATLRENDFTPFMQGLYQW